MAASPRNAPRVDREQKKPRTDESRIKVVVRKRPLSQREAHADSDGILEVPSSVSGLATIIVHEPKIKVDLTSYVEQHKFVYDHVFDESSTNVAVYRETAAPLIRSCKLHLTLHEQKHVHAPPYLRHRMIVLTPPR